MERWGAFMKRLKDVHLPSIVWVSLMSVSTMSIAPKLVTLETSDVRLWIHGGAVLGCMSLYGCWFFFSLHRSTYGKQVRVCQDVYFAFAIPMASFAVSVVPLSKDEQPHSSIAGLTFLAWTFSVVLGMGSQRRILRQAAVAAPLYTLIELYLHHLQHNVLEAPAQSLLHFALYKLPLVAVAPVALACAIVQLLRLRMESVASSINSLFSVVVVLSALFMVHQLSMVIFQVLQGREQDRIASFKTLLLILSAFFLGRVDLFNTFSSQMKSAISVLNDLLPSHVTQAVLEGEKDEDRASSPCHSSLQDLPERECESPPGALRKSIRLDRVSAPVSPSQVPDELIELRNKTTKWADNCTILFADIVGYTSMSDEVSPEEVMHFLNSLYEKFDNLCRKYGEGKMYKVETVGDCYVIASGLLRENQQHAQILLEMAHQMLLAAEATLVPTTHTPTILRIGINSGPVCSGIVGNLRRKFCLYGDTINVTARMETTAKHGGIHISGSTYALVEHLGQDWAFEERTTQVKGKGEMDTYDVTYIGPPLEPLYRLSTLSGPRPRSYSPAGDTPPMNSPLFTADQEYIRSHRRSVNALLPEGRDVPHVRFQCMGGWGERVDHMEIKRDSQELVGRGVKGLRQLREFAMSNPEHKRSMIQLFELLPGDCPGGAPPGAMADPSWGT